MNMKTRYKIFIACACVIVLAIGGFTAYKEKTKSNKTESEKIPDITIEKQKESSYSEIAENKKEAGEKQKNSETESKIDEEEKLLTQMSLEDKVAQMFVTFLDSFAETENVTEADARLKEQFFKYPVGGILMMKNNIETPEQITELNKQLKQISCERTGLYPFLCIDEEGGMVTRIAKNSEFPVTDVGDMSEIGATGDPTEAYQVGTTIGSYLKEYQFNVDFAPDADVLVNPDNEVIGKRSFGSDESSVSKMVTQEIKGLHQENICTAAKHFPGHGATEEDSHQGFAYSERTLEQIRECELLPFQAAIREGTEFVMVGHISYPEITGDDEPASLSQYMITDLLRNEMKYNGIVITDAMNMGAISQNYSSGEATVKAVQAGVDIILEPADFMESYHALFDAVEDGTISEERIDESVRRILKVKSNLKK